MNISNLAFIGSFDINAQRAYIIIKLSIRCCRLASLLVLALVSSVDSPPSPGLIIKTFCKHQCAHLPHLCTSNIRSIWSVLFKSRTFSLFLYLPLLPVRVIVEFSYFTQMCIDRARAHRNKLGHCGKNWVYQHMWLHNSNLSELHMSLDLF